MAKEEAEKWRKPRKTSCWGSLDLGCHRDTQNGRRGHSDDSGHAEGCKGPFVLRGVIHFVMSSFQKASQGASTVI